jgi:hypothetical protein
MIRLKAEDRPSIDELLAYPKIQRILTSTDRDDKLKQKMKSLQDKEVEIRHKDLMVREQEIAEKERLLNEILRLYELP